MFPNKSRRKIKPANVYMLTYIDIIAYRSTTVVLIYFVWTGPMFTSVSSANGVSVPTVKIMRNLIIATFLLWMINHVAIPGFWRLRCYERWSLYPYDNMYCVFSEPSYVYNGNVYLSRCIYLRTHVVYTRGARLRVESTMNIM